MRKKIVLNGVRYSAGPVPGGHSFGARVGGPSDETGTSLIIAQSLSPEKDRALILGMFPEGAGYDKIRRKIAERRRDGPSSQILLDTSADRLALSHAWWMLGDAPDIRCTAHRWRAKDLYTGQRGGMVDPMPSDKDLSALAEAHQFIEKVRLDARHMPWMTPGILGILDYAADLGR